MQDELKNLLILQDRDTKIYKAKADLESIPEEAAKIKENLSQKVSSVAEAKKAVLNAQKDVQQLELDRQTRKDTILKLKTRQGETKRNEEYQMLAHEVIRYTAEIDELETSELELMERVDRKKEERELAEKRFLEEKSLAVELSQQLVKKKKTAEEKLKVLTVERSQLEKNVDADSKALYERILKARGIGAIVLLTSSAQCTGCNIKLPPATLHHVQAGTKIVQCSECSRILYNA